MNSVILPGSSRVYLAGENAINDLAHCAVAALGLGYQLALGNHRGAGICRGAGQAREFQRTEIVNVITNEADILGCELMMLKKLEQRRALVLARLEHLSPWKLRCHAVYQRAVFAGDQRELHACFVSERKTHDVGKAEALPLF